MRPIRSAVTSTERLTITRTIEYTYDWAAGTMTRTGPDGVETFVQYDVANRVQSYRRGPASSPIMTATYTYSPDDLVDTITFGNGASTHYSRDDARRITAIDHRNAAGTTFLKLEYAYTADDLPASISESDATGILAVVTFTYDARHRLIHEVRQADPATEYDVAYTYDQGGNRLVKIDALNQRRVEYHYDLEDPGTYASRNNRLMYSETFDTSGQSSMWLGSTYYYYNESGNVTRVVDEDAVNFGSFAATRLEYAKNGATVTYVLGETWDVDGPDPDTCPDNYTITFAREFRYDSARARYLNRQLDPVWLMQNPPVFVALSETWTDYDEEEIYGDYQLSGGIPAELDRFELGVAESAGGVTSYDHADLIGTRRRQSVTGGTPSGAVTYTAFGERIAGMNHRYGYAGSWGYQSHSEFPFLHVGYRYYDPGTGRFLQRDPDGITDSLLVYAYVGLVPTDRVDLDGLKWVKVGKFGYRWHDGKRFAKAPLWRRLPGAAARRVPVYLCASAVARTGHAALGKPYEDPVGVIAETVGNLARAATLQIQDWRKRRTHRGVFGGAG